MRLVTELINSENINKYKVDGLVIASSKYSVFTGKSFQDEEIGIIVKQCKDNNIMTILSVDRIMHERDLQALAVDLDFYLSLSIDYFIYSDFAILKYFKDRSLASKLIYDAKTMITNSEDALIHKEFAELVQISNELTLEEISKISEVGNTVFEVYGHHQIFYSRRNILTSYKDFSNTLHDLEDVDLIIKEELRDGKFPVKQTKNGFFVYTDFRYVMFKELLELRNKFKIIRINASFIPEDELFKVIEIYNLIKTAEKNDIDTLYDRLKDIFPNLESGHLYNASVLLGGEKK